MLLSNAGVFLACYFFFFIGGLTCGLNRDASEVKECVTDHSSGTIGVDWSCPRRNRVYGHSVTPGL